MFAPIKVPYESVMLFNRIKLKDGVTIDDVEMALGEMCNVVKNTYANDGFIAGQVFEFNGFVSNEGSINNSEKHGKHIAIITYWKTFDQHEKSHADKIFNEKFSALMEYVDKADELGYQLLWQGEPE